MKKWIAGLGTAAAMVLTLTATGSARQTLEVLTAEQRDRWRGD